MRKSILYRFIGGAAIVLALAAVLWTRARTHHAGRILNEYTEDANFGSISIRYPLDGTLFPPEIIPPGFEWSDTHPNSDLWLISIQFGDGKNGMAFLSQAREWTPPDDKWQVIKRRSVETMAKITLYGFQRKGPKKFLSKASFSIGTSGDPVGAPIFYREVNLPFADAVVDPSRIRWRFGEISSKKRPPIVLENLPVCGNCHSFSSDGSILGMDVDYANDKGSYTVVRTAKEMVLEKKNILTWSDYQKEKEEPTYGLLSQVSPDGRFVVSTVKDRSVFVAVPNLEFSQLFFPVKGILAVYSRATGTFSALPGGDERNYVQSNPSWSPDGKNIVFARSSAFTLKSIHDRGGVLLTIDECREFIERDRLFKYDLYRIPFNDGEGGRPEPLRGASNNGMSNYFAKYSPDGKWIVFCKASSFMLLQKDSELHIIPADGGEARRLACNTGRMNSWHSWSPNSRWLVFSSKANSAYTQLFLTHINGAGSSSPPVLLSQFTAQDRAANIPEFVRLDPNGIRKISENFIDDFSFLRAAMEYMRADDYANAEAACRKALTINPNNLDAQLQLAVVLESQGRPAEAVAPCREAVRIDPKSGKAHAQLGNLLWQCGNHGEGMAHLVEGVRLDPSDSGSRIKLGQALLEGGKKDEALAHFKHAVSSPAATYRTHRSIADILTQYGESGLAAAGYLRALELEPDDAHSLNNLAITSIKQGKPGQAAVYYRRALSANSNALPSLKGLAALLISSNDPKLGGAEEAIRLSDRACELTRRQEPESLSMLADAYAMAGRFREAVKTANTALRLANLKGKARLAANIQKRIGYYQTRSSDTEPAP